MRLFQLQRESESESPHPGPLPIRWGEGGSFRTALLKDGKAYVQAGGGWVNNSEPDAEFQETVNQSKAMLKAVSLAEAFANGK